MKVRFNVYEIEHFDDEERAFTELREAGCTNLFLIARDHEEGMVRVECDLPDNITSPTQLKLETTCL
jgi:hypothetical protein